MSKAIFIAIICIAVALYLQGRAGVKDGKTIETKSGAVRGIISKSRDGREFYEWLGIPYARPPVGKLRFASPEPIDKWDGVKDTQMYGNKCAHLETLSYRFTGEEDCLFLNVHTPTVDGKEKLPVMVFIHGGGFNLGTTKDYRPDYFMDEEVVIVTPNYRLGVFGFLTTWDKSIRGNMGLKDQVLALRWVKENIQFFGGDPNKITIFGESAGGASVHYLMLSPTTRGLFNKAISQSGVATTPWGFDSPQVARNYTAKYAEDVGCPSQDSSKLVECLRNKSKEELLQAAVLDMKTESVTHPQGKGHLVLPTIEGVDDSEAFLAEHPLKIVAEGRASRAPWMTGVTADEGLLSSVEFYNEEKHMQSYEENWDENLLRTFAVTHRRIPAEVAQKVRDFYFPGDKSLTRELKLEQYTKMFSDAHFNLQMSETVQLQRNFSSVYLYHYGRRGGPSLAPLLAEIKSRFSLIVELMIYFGKQFVNRALFGTLPHDYGVCHGDDLGMQFYMPFIFKVSKDDSSEDYVFSKEIVKFWVDFARDETNVQFKGVPLPRAKATGRLQYLDLNQSPKLIYGPFEERLGFLKSLNMHLR